ncbi:23S rRNA (uracil-5-)-methyltransferase RumA [Planctomycetales bacterium]|nr:23S rRNA (uracil-5-)-methyltransferase RumA [Planctomycetales bacterium]
MKKIRPRERLQQYLREALAGAPRVAPPCPHFGECGGCEYQNYAYSAQVAAKAAVWRRLVADAGLTLPEAHLARSQAEYGYRQRMDYVFAFGNAGLRRAGSHKHVVALTACPLCGDAGWRAFVRARDLAVAADLPAYDYLRHTGFLRYFVVRQTRRGEVMLNLVTKTPEFADKIETIATTLLAEGLAASVHWLCQESAADLSFGAPVRFWGRPVIYATYLGKDFAIGPNTFAQANALTAEQAYGEIVAANRGEPLLGDIYAGSGVIGDLLAPTCGHVVAVENVPENLALAREHAAAHRLDNWSLCSADAGQFLRDAATRAEQNGAGEFSAVVVNPPRVGLAGAVAALLAVAPPRLTYMSCNPLTLLDDLKILLPHYVAEKIMLFDMFPQTPHWETLALLRRR